MEKINIPNEFVQKLKEKGAYEKFIANLTEQDKTRCKYAIPSNLHLYKHSFMGYVAHAFIWDATPEGFVYWLRIVTS